MPTQEPTLFSVQIATTQRLARPAQARVSGGPRAAARGGVATGGGR